jgi:hypothetical protein
MNLMHLANLTRHTNLAHLANLTRHTNFTHHDGILTGIYQNDEKRKAEALITRLGSKK